MRNVQSNGLCLSKPMIDLIFAGYKDGARGENYPFSLVFRKGVLQEPAVLQEVIEEMGEDDVYVKAVNAVDNDGNMGILLCVSGGGSIGNVIRNKIKRGYKILAVAGLEKKITTPIKEAAKACLGLDRATGIKCNLTTLKSDAFISEIEAFKTLTGCTAVPVSCGGINGMEGGYTFVLEGEEEQLDKAWQIWEEIRGSQLPPIPAYDCSSCPWKACNRSPAYDPAFSKVLYVGPEQGE